MSEKHFCEQKRHSKSYLIPFFKKQLPDFENLRILDVGCAEAGFLDSLYDLGMDAIGLELEDSRAKIAEAKNPMLKIFVGDITDEDIAGRLGGVFDLIVMRDVMEHIPDKMAAFRMLNRLLKMGGHLYTTFPPRFSPLAGHQQNGQSILRWVPYLHLLPAGMIRTLGRIFREKPALVEHVILNYRIGLSIRSFEKHCSMFNFRPVVKELFLLRPIYKTRFGIAARRVPHVPFVCKWIALGCECLSRKVGEGNR
ncbi:MAG: class I SAM-dependent methyltransferase [Candidatus Latescibacterota bacterium]